MREKYFKQNIYFKSCINLVDEKDFLKSNCESVLKLTLVLLMFI